MTGWKLPLRGRRMPDTAAPNLWPDEMRPFGWLSRRRERRRREREIVGLLWVWDRVVPMSRAQAEWAELHVLPFGVSVLRDDR